MIIKSIKLITYCCWSSIWIVCEYESESVCQRAVFYFKLSFFQTSMNSKFLFLTCLIFALYIIPSEYKQTFSLQQFIPSKWTIKNFIITCILVTCKCYIDIKKDLVNNFAPILYNHQKSFIYPKDNSTILSFQKNQSFLISCAGKGNSLIIKDLNLKTNSLTVTCNNTKHYSLSTPTDNKAFQFINVRCQKFPQPELRSATISHSEFSLCKREKYRHFVSGYAVDEDSFLGVFDTCYDQKENKPIIAFSKILPGVRNKQIWKRKSPPFSNTKTHRYINSAYLRVSQIAYFNQVFGDDQQYLTSIYAPLNCLNNSLNFN